MAWLTDVAPYSVIQSSWGNSVRDRIVQTFADWNEANAHIGQLPENSIAAIGAYYYRKLSGAWRPLLPAHAYGQVFSANLISNPSTIASLMTPVGYSVALLWYNGRSDQLTPDTAVRGSLSFSITMGGSGIYGTQETIEGANVLDTRQIHSLSLVVGVNTAGVQIQVHVSQYMPGGVGQRRFVSTDGSASFMALCLP